MNRVWISLDFGVLGAAVASVLASAFGVKCLGFTAGIEVSKSCLNVTSMSCNTLLAEFLSGEAAGWNAARAGNQMAGAMSTSISSVWGAVLSSRSPPTGTTTPSHPGHSHLCTPGLLTNTLITVAI